MTTNRVDEFLRSNRALETALNDVLMTMNFQQIYRTVRDINVELSRPLIEELLEMGELPQAKPVQSKVNPRVSKVMIQDAVSKGDVCPIGLEPLKAETAACVAPCYHVFEKQAIETWLKSSNLCPQCRESCFR